MLRAISHIPVPVLHAVMGITTVFLLVDMAASVKEALDLRDIAGKMGGDPWRDAAVAKKSRRGYCLSG